MPQGDYKMHIHSSYESLLAQSCSHFPIFTIFVALALVGKRRGAKGPEDKQGGKDVGRERV